jgi:hypothetical protein
MAAAGSRALRGLIVALVVLVVLLIAADRIGLYYAERSAAETIQSSQHLSSRPDVAIAGFPFLTQLAAGDFDEITVTARHVPVGQDVHLLDISRIRVVLRDITVSRSFSSVRAATAKAVAGITYADLGKTLGVDISYAGGGRVKASKTITIAGQTVSGSITAEPSLTNGTLSFVSARINAGDQAAGALSTVLNKVFDLTVPLQGIPFNVRVQSLRTDSHGLSLTLAGTELTYST